MENTRLAGLAAWVALAAATCAAQSAGIFETHGDLGANSKKGSLEYDAGKGSYRVTGGGANMWGTEDALHFVWKRMMGDVALQADVEFMGAGAVAHRKAVLMVRQDLSTGSRYADIALHGDGLTSLQFRPVAGGLTSEVRSPVKGPTRIRLERRGDTFTMAAGAPGRELTQSGPQFVKLSDPVYVGIGVCSHDADVLETAIFSNVTLEPIERPADQRFRSKLAIFDVETRTSRVIYEANQVIEAPNWSRDGKFLLVNTGGDLYRLPLGTDGEPLLEKIDLGGEYRANNDHDLSFDGTKLALSASSPSSPQSQVYVVNSDGTGAKLLTPDSPSYFHGWSPDGQWLAFVGRRNGKYELFRVPVGGGPEQRLTSAGAYDDGPEYTPDGQWIYFNSNRAGAWHIWRIPAEGGGPNDSKAQQVTTDGPEDWFPHISPDGKRMVFLSFPEGTEGHNGRMEGMSLRLMAVPGDQIEAAEIEVLARFFGGQGTINVNSWSPDSRRFGYVIYEPL